MLVLKYFMYVGGSLLALLLLCAALLPKPPVADSTVASASDVPAIRIHSQQKWPERVVLDTNAPMPAPAKVAQAVVAPAEPQAARRGGQAAGSYRCEEAGSEAAGQTQDRQAPGAAVLSAGLLWLSRLWLSAAIFATPDAGSATTPFWLFLVSGPPVATQAPFLSKTSWTRTTVFAFKARRRPCCCARGESWSGAFNQHLQGRWRRVEAKGRHQNNSQPIKRQPTASLLGTTPSRWMRAGLTLQRRRGPCYASRSRRSRCPTFPK